MKQLIDALEIARKNFLQNKLGLDATTADSMVVNEMSALNNNPNTTITATSASELVPTAVQLNDVIETAPAGRVSFLQGLVQGRQAIRSLNNEYPIL